MDYCYWLYVFVVEVHRSLEFAQTWMNARLLNPFQNQPRKTCLYDTNFGRRPLDKMKNSKSNMLNEIVILMLDVEHIEGFHKMWISFCSEGKTERNLQSVQQTGVNYCFCCCLKHVLLFPSSFLPSFLILTETSVLTLASIGQCTHIV